MPKLIMCGKHFVPRSQCGCPATKRNPKGNYPLDTKKRAANAHARYMQKRTRKCAGGLARIKRAERRLGVKAERHMK